MKNFLPDLLDIFKRTYQDWKEDHASRLAASLAYYTIFSLAPLLVIAIAIAGFIWRHEDVEAQIMAQSQSLVGVEGATFIADMIRSASNPTPRNSSSSARTMLATTGRPESASRTPESPLNCHGAPTAVACKLAMTK